MVLVSQIFTATRGNQLVGHGHLLGAMEVNRSLNWGRHQVVCPGAQSRVVGLNHPQHRPIHNEVQPFIRDKF